MKNENIEVKEEVENIVQEVKVEAKPEKESLEEQVKKLNDVVLKLSKVQAQSPEVKKFEGVNHEQKIVKFRMPNGKINEVNDTKSNNLIYKNLGAVKIG